MQEKKEFLLKNFSLSLSLSLSGTLSQQDEKQSASTSTKAFRQRARLKSVRLDRANPSNNPSLILHFIALIYQINPSLICT
jgi:hypothetical protein